MIGALRRLVAGGARVWQTPDWTEFAGNDWHAHLMSAALSDRFHAKQGRSIARWTVRSESGTLSVYVKRHERHSRLRGFMARLWPFRVWSDAGREWHHLEAARSLGLFVPRPLAMAEWSGPGVQLRSALVVEELSEMLALHEAIPVAAKVLGPARFRDHRPHFLELAEDRADARALAG